MWDVNDGRKKEAAEVLAGAGSRSLLRLQGWQRGVCARMFQDYHSRSAGHCLQVDVTQRRALDGVLVHVGIKFRRPTNISARALWVQTRGREGQIIEAVGQKVVTEDRGDMLVLNTAPRAHPDFETYLLFVSSTKGLAKVASISKTIQTNSFGTELQSKFSEIEKALETKYGKPTKTFDFLMSGSIWHEPQEWTMALLKKERTLTAAWETLPGTTIIMDAHASSRELGYILVSYEFTSQFSTWTQEHDQKKNSSF
jgi:hypothetical protein